MIATATTSVYRLARGDVDERLVMDWSCPVPYFGRLRSSALATVGINPSSREFVDSSGDELDGERRRFPTLGSLGLETWADASSLDLGAIVDACDQYFSVNPYSRWFDVLDSVTRAVGASFYSSESPAAHLDLVPYATHVKWGALTLAQQRALLRSGRDLVGALLRESAVELLVLNGASVVRQFEQVADVVLNREPGPGWDLPRQRSEPIRGIAYAGLVDRIGAVELGRTITVAGYNHNLQSSFGVTKSATTAIASWIASQT